VAHADASAAAKATLAALVGATRALVGSGRRGAGSAWGAVPCAARRRLERCAAAMALDLGTGFANGQVAE
jgi:hypothetical protein